ncbi:hypothetical protein CXG81DRAFT_17815 [Caulochytrium protostelioides]|uniref:Pre-mRNA-splicing factor ISY1 n=1 Tax=Caulochytrium protostelioides TaxID=1555241 RepID=A0A4V1IV21_9FUNG|nr:hypothetical protein CXG81DRAFT_17815 [Caulochytrium protostelioides]|eukprot:RKP02539.1 hypothetical protein CXG81DRAFT_17815 [Caulochytrium protostelioides]
MARNEEKAKSTLHRYLAAKDKEAGLGGDETSKRGKRRPFHTSQCDSLQDADRWRKDVIADIRRGISRINNPDVPEHELRELNDRINKLFLEKYHWEKRIKELGGPSYHDAPLSKDATASLGEGRYKYFGRAKDLPGVKELFEKRQKQRTKEQRQQLYKRVDIAYYGGLAEQGARGAELLAWEAEQTRRLQEQRAKTLEREGGIVNNGGFAIDMAESYALDLPWTLPTQAEVLAHLLARKKAEILAKYGGSGASSDPPSSMTPATDLSS